MRNFEQLEIWKRSHQLTLEVYTLTRTFPREEMFVLTTQMRRSSSSIPTNIAEGCGRRTKGELKRFLDISAGSTSELQYQLFLCQELDYVKQIISRKLVNEAIEIRKMIYAFSERL